MGGDLGRTGGDGPFLVKTYFASKAKYEAKYELTKKGLKEDFSVLKKRFLVKNRVI